jgi:GH43 family beta-xylosidase
MTGYNPYNNYKMRIGGNCGGWEMKKPSMLIIAAFVIIASLYYGCASLITSPGKAYSPESTPNSLRLTNLLFPTLQSVVAPAVTFRNPLNHSVPDPWMTYYDGNYYLATTTWGGPSIGLTMRKAETIAGLKKAAPARIWQDGDPNRCCNYWAPEFFLLDGPNGLHWYGYYTGGPADCCDNQRIHVIESAGIDPMGPYVYAGQLKDSTDDRSIDASILQLRGSLYLLFAARIGNEQRIYIAPMKTPWSLSDDRVLLSAPSYGWEKEGMSINQGPVALQHDGRTFIVYSASYCGSSGYKLGMLTYTGGDPVNINSWTKSPSPIFKGANDVFSPGHNTFFKSPDGSEDWIVYHANDSSSGGCDMNRTPRIQRFTWNSDGTPNFGDPVSIHADLNVPSGEGRPG